MKLATLFLLALFFTASSATAQSRKPSTIAELVLYRGPDREQVLYAGAKGEGKVVW